MSNLSNRVITVLLAAAITVSAQFREPAAAAECHGNSNALGTSRTIVVSPSAYTHLGTIQYPATLPLADKEVVITFDDGPSPRSTNSILDTLAAQCVKATFFMVGEMARTFPAVARRVYDEGHSIGTHSEDHPLHFGSLSEDKLHWEVEEGIADVAAALGNTQDVGPFFRIPGFSRSSEVENELATRPLVVFSADIVADDWHRRIRPNQIIARAIARLEKRGRGILLLHDIHRATAAALPGLLKQLKDHGFRIVQMIQGRPVPMANYAQPQQPSGTSAPIPQPLSAQ